MFWFCSVLVVIIAVAVCVLVLFLSSVVIMAVAVCVLVFVSVFGGDNSGGGVIKVKVCYIYASYIFFSKRKVHYLKIYYNFVLILFEVR